MQSKIYIYIFFTCLIAPCKALEWYSKISEKEIIVEDNKFFENNNLKLRNLITALKQFKTGIENNDLQLLYDFRSEPYRKTVPFKNFVEEIHGKSELPSRVYFSLNGSVFGKNTAKIRSYYVVSNNQFESCYDTFDNWEYDNAKSKWIFVSNSLSWGSQIVIESNGK